MYRYCYANDAYLEHHGIKGMKWGIRRFQNEDGSYTQAGLKRYRYDENNYNEARNKYIAAKAAYKSGEGTEAEYRKSRADMKAAKKQLSRAYDQVKKDSKADKGKRLYESGQRITSNVIGENVKQLAVALIGNVAAHKLRELGRNGSANALCIAGNAFLAGSYIKTKVKNRRIAAYYSHSRPKDLKTPSENWSK